MMLILFFISLVHLTISNKVHLSILISMQMVITCMNKTCKELVNISKA